ncbi:MAG TPA: hypothetical protein VK188_02560 [Holophaga sp.]|nr:hypothetical protein [Holophaga sp.]
MARRIGRRLGWLALALPLGAQAVDAPWRLSGFGTLGLAATDTREVGFIRDLGQPYPGVRNHLNARPDSRLGVQLDLRFTETLRGAAQVVSKQQWDGSFRPTLTAAYLAYNPVGNLEIRAGRLGVHQVLGTDSRDVGYAHLWVRPNVEGLGFMPFNHFDGVDLKEDISLGASTRLTLKAFTGLAYEKVPVAGSDPIDFAGSSVAGLAVDLQRGPWQARLVWDHWRNANNFPASIAILQQGLQYYAGILQDPRLLASADAINPTGSKADFRSLALAYEKGPIQFHGSIGRLTRDRPALPDSWSGYLSLGWRLGAFVPYATFSRAVSDRPPVPELGAMPSLPDPVSQALVGGVRDLMRAGAMDQRTVSAGLRWDFAENADLKFQVDRVSAHDSTAGWQVIQPGWNGRATVFTVTLDFIFGRGR